MSQKNRFTTNWQDQQREWLRDSRGQHRDSYMCKVCNVDCQGTKGLEAHLNGKKCRKKHRLLQRELDAAAAASSSTSASSASASSASSTTSSTDQPSPKKKKPKREMTPMQDYRKQMGICSKHRNLQQAMTLFRARRDNDVFANLSIYNSLLFLCCEETSIELRNTASLEILQDMTVRQVKYDETAFSNAIRLTSMSGHTSKAMSILQEMRENNEAPKRRTYAPIFQYHPAATHQDLHSINTIYLECEKDKVECTEDEFHAMLQACVTVQQHTQATTIDLANEAMEVSIDSSSDATDSTGASTSSSSTPTPTPTPTTTTTTTATTSCSTLSPEHLFKLTLYRMKELVPHVSSLVLDTLRTWCSTTTTHPTIPTTILTPTAIHQTTCLCTHCHQQLQSIDLTPSQNNDVLLQIDQVLASDPTGTFQNHFNRFKKWMQRFHPKGVEVVIDGANVGFFGRRPPKEGLSFQQIDRVIRAFTDCPNPQDRKNILLILHIRHFKRLTEKQKNIVHGWKKENFLYQTPHRMNDDWFWLWCAVWSSRFVTQPFVITNDQMRDHHFQMLSSKHFLKWRERHVVRFGFDQLYNQRSPPILWFPLPYSTQIHADAKCVGNVGERSSGESREERKEDAVDGVEEWCYHLPTKVSTEKEGEMEVFEWYCLSVKL